MPDLPSTDQLAALVVRTADGDTPAARLGRAVEIGRELAERGDELIERFVSEARAAGASWNEIGQAFGTSKQAAQKRYGTGTSQPEGWPGRWAPAARQALESASGQARALGHSYVGTEHVLLGLRLARDGIAAQVLKDLGVTGEGILARARPAPHELQADACLSIMPRLKRALELAVRLAERQGHRTADSEHLLAAITQVPDTRAIDLLDVFGVTAEDVRLALARRLDVDPDSLRLTRAGRRSRRSPG